MKRTWLIGGLFLVSGLLRGEEAVRPIPVAVTAAEVQEWKSLDEAAKTDLKTKKDAAHEARETLEKQLKSQYGKKREEWPPEKDDELVLAEEEEHLAAARYAYRKIELKSLEDSVRDIEDAIKGSKRLTLVATPAEAKILLEIEGRRSWGIPGSLNDKVCSVLFSLHAGEKTDASQFAQIPPQWKYKKWTRSAWKIQDPRSGSPLFRFEAHNYPSGSIKCWGRAAGTVNVVVEKFVEDNQSVFTSN